MQFKQYKNIIFDFDKTLVTLLIDWSSWQEGVASIIKKYDSSFDETSNIRSHNVAGFVDKYGKNFLKDYVNFGRMFEENNYHGYEPITKTINLLKKMYQENKNVYLLTSNASKTAVPILKELKIDCYFTKIISSDDVKNLKPSSSPFRLIAQKNFNKTEYLMVGDSLSDKGFAESVGIDYLDVQDI